MAKAPSAPAKAESEFPTATIGVSHLLKPGQEVVFRPQPRQELFLSSPAFEGLFGGALGGGKQVRLDEPIPTPEGWSTVGGLRVGDAVFDERGQVCRVTHLHPIDNTPVSYRLVFDDGTAIEACADHQWLTFDKSERSAVFKRTPEYRAARRLKRASRASGRRSALFSASLSARNAANPPATKEVPTGTVRTTAAIARSVRDWRGNVQYSIPVAGALDLPDVALPLDPYLMGVWLGDGHSSGGAVTTADDEILQAFADAGFTTRHYSRYTHGVRGLVIVLKPLGVVQNKHIPISYLRASRDQRLALLQGLMDTDGTVAKHSGSAEFTTTSEALANGTYELVVSLGWKVSLRKGVAKLDGREIGPKWTLKWVASDYVFRLPRKRNIQKLASSPVTRHRYIVSCEPCASSPMRCLTVDSPSHLFLVGKSMVPTHNSTAILYGSTRYYDRPSYRALILRKTFPELRELMDEAVSIFPSMGGRWVASEKRFVFPSGATIEFGYCIHGSTPILMGDGSYRAMRDVKRGDLVQTLEGPRRVTSHWFVGQREAVSIRVGAGTTYASADHALLTADGRWMTPRALAHETVECAGTDHITAPPNSSGAALPPEWSAHLAQHVPARPRSPVSAHDTAPPCASGHAALLSAPPDSPVDCRPALRSGDALAQLEVRDARARIQRPADAGTRDRMEQHSDGQGNTPARTPWGDASYSHPYTNEQRPVGEDVRDCLAEMAPAGVQSFWDMSVEEVNHYITYSGLIHKNCETYAEVLQYRGQQYQYIAYDEIGDLVDERVWTFLLTRLRNGKDPDMVKMARCTANPGGAGEPWLMARFIDKCGKDGELYVDPETGNTRCFVQSKLQDNPELLKNDPEYARRLLVLSSTERKQLLDGHWGLGSVKAFPSLTEHSHVVKQSPVPDYAQCFGGFDWGFGHRWSFSVAYGRPGGKLRIVDSCGGRKQTPDVIVDRIRDLLTSRKLKISSLNYTVAGSDVKIRDEARGAYGPSVMEQFGVAGLWLLGADQSRIAGYQNLLRYIDHRLIEWEDTPGNHMVIATLRRMVTDPDNPNDVLKVDSNPLTGEGGDDDYDQTRYLAMSRPIASVEPVQTSAVEQRVKKYMQKKPERDPRAIRMPRTLSLNAGTRTLKVA